MINDNWLDAQWALKWRYLFSVTTRNKGKLLEIECTKFRQMKQRWWINAQRRTVTTIINFRVESSHLVSLVSRSTCKLLKSPLDFSCSGTVYLMRKTYVLPAISICSRNTSMKSSSSVWTYLFISFDAFDGPSWYSVRLMSRMRRSRAWRRICLVGILE